MSEALARRLEEEEILRALAISESAASDINSERAQIEAAIALSTESAGMSGST